ncbi:hypothetical protein, partial [Burkholderia sp.]|uniref:hypothetical protein n=1 Tax=Burkholderia sp. TaxID=36773 RepID=UPI00258FE26B
KSGRRRQIKASQKIHNSQNRCQSQNGNIKYNATHPFHRLSLIEQIDTLSAMQGMNHQPIMNCERLYLKM